MKHIEYEEFELKIFPPYQPPVKSKAKKGKKPKTADLASDVAQNTSPAQPATPLDWAAQGVYSIRVMHTPIRTLGLGRMTQLNLSDVIQFVRVNLPSGYAPVDPLNQTLDRQANNATGNTSTEVAAFSSQYNEAKFNFHRREWDSLMQTAGQMLYETLPEPIPSAINEAYLHCRKAGKGLRININLTLTPHLYVLPWELLFHQGQNDYFTLSKNTPIRRVVETPTQLADSHEITIKDLRRVLLVLIASQSGDEKLIQQTLTTFEQLTLALQQKGRAIHIDQLSGYVSLERLQTHLATHEDYDLIHFVGHGVWDGVNSNTALIFHSPAREPLPESTIFKANAGYGETSASLAEINFEEALKLATVEVGAADLRRLFSDLNSLKLVFLNSCQSGRIAFGHTKSFTEDLNQSNLESEDSERAFDNLGPGLGKNGVPAIISMQYEVGRLAAGEFARSFYTALSEGVTISQAVVEGRKTLAQKGLYQPALYNQWFVPVYYQSTVPDTVPETLLNRSLDSLTHLAFRTEQPMDYVGLLLGMLIVGIGVGWLGPAIRLMTRESNLITVIWFTSLSYFYRSLIAAWFYRDLRLNPLFKLKNFQGKFYLALSTYIGATLGHLTGLFFVYFIYSWFVLMCQGWLADLDEDGLVGGLLNLAIILPATTIAALYARRIPFTNRFTTLIFKASGQELFIGAALLFSLFDIGIAVLLLQSPGLWFNPLGATFFFLLLIFFILISLRKLTKTEQSGS